MFRLQLTQLSIRDSSTNTLLDSQGIHGDDGESRAVAQVHKLDSRKIDLANQRSRKEGVAIPEDLEKIEFGDDIFGPRFEQIEEMLGWRTGRVTEGEFGDKIIECRLRHHRRAYGAVKECEPKQRVVIMEVDGVSQVVEVESLWNDSSVVSPDCAQLAACLRAAWVGREAPALRGGAIEIEAYPFSPYFNMTQETSDAEYLAVYEAALANAQEMVEKRAIYIVEQQRLDVWSNERRNSLYASHRTQQQNVEEYERMIDAFASAR